MPNDHPLLHITFVFVDGIGLGPEGEFNPFSTLALPALEALGGGQQWTVEARFFATPRHVFRPLDAALGVDGLPQSGTGQTTLFTGVNAAEIAGRHYGPYPHSATHALLETDSLFARLPRAARAFANAYPDRFFSYSEQTNRWSTTTRMCRGAGVRLRTEADLHAGQAIAADLTGQGWRDGLGLDVPPVLPAQAGARLHALAQAHSVTLFEYYLTDKAGHGRGTRTAASVLHDLDAFLGGYLKAFDSARDLLILTSDHGNLENLAVKSHTLNPVPLVAYGHRADAFARATSLLDVTPTIVRLVDEMA